MAIPDQVASLVASTGSATEDSPVHEPVEGPLVRQCSPISDATESTENTDSTENLLCFETNLAGAYNANNIAAAIAVGLHFGVSLEDAIQAVSEYIPKNNRSQLERQIATF